MPNAIALGPTMRDYEAIFAGKTTPELDTALRSLRGRRVGVFGRCPTGRTLANLLGQRCATVMDSETLADAPRDLDAVIIATRPDFNGYFIDLLAVMGFTCPVYALFGPVRAEWQGYEPIEPPLTLPELPLRVESAADILKRCPELGSAHAVSFGGVEYAYYRFPELLVLGDRAPAYCLPDGACGSGESSGMRTALHENQDYADAAASLPLLGIPRHCFARRKSRGMAVLGNCNTRYFGHVMHDMLPKLLLLEHAGYAGRYLLAARTPWLTALATAMGVAEERLDYYNAPLVLEDAVIFQRFRCELLMDNPTLVLELRERLLRHFGLRQGPRTRRLYLTRRAATYRHVINEEELRRMLERHGYETIAFETLDLAGQIELMLSARSLVAPHGSGSALSLFLDRDTAFVQMHNPSFINDGSCRPFVRTLGVDYHSFVTAEDPGPAEVMPSQRHLIVDVERLERLVRTLP